MIEKTIIEYLGSKLSVPCYMERPESEHCPTSYVLLEKTGGSVKEHIYTSTFAFQSYAPSLLEAVELNDEVKAAAESLIVLPSITKSKYQTDYNFTNPAAKQYRYQAVFDITHY